jgi:peptide/nickel transport system ATP-binding protein
MSVATDQATPLLRVNDLRVSFRTEQGVVQAIDGISFTVNAGEILGVVGESGSGKTISLLSVMGLILDPNVTITGSIIYKGRELIGLPQKELRRIRGREIAMIFQDAMTALTPVYTVGWQIAEQIQAHEKLSSRAAQDRAVAMLEAVGIPAPKETAERFPHELSGGMRQRVMIAMALSCSPSLLIADEPTTALDVTVQAQILDLISKLRRDFGSAVVFITHDMGVIAEIADRVMVMYAGRIVETGSKRQVLKGTRHPYTRALLDSIPSLRGPRLNRLKSIAGLPPSLLALPAGCAFAPRCTHRFAACSERPSLSFVASAHASGTGESHQAACFLRETAWNEAENHGA